jgi:hypothetical protein
MAVVLIGICLTKKDYDTVSMLNNRKYTESSFINFINQQLHYISSSIKQKKTEEWVLLPPNYILSLATVSNLLVW